MATPKLRFKEFDGDWCKSDFAKASIIIIDGDRGANYPKSDDFYDEEFCLFLNAGNVTKQGFIFENTQFITQEKDQLLRKGKLVRNDLVITTRGTVGNVAYFDKSIPFENMRINSGMVIARCQNNVLADFVNQFLKSDLFEKWLDKNAFGSAQPQLTVKLLNSIQLNYPSKGEQTKIASFLSVVDEKISQLTQKHELMSQYKQGMMQKLFSQQIRFKADDGSEFGEWENKKIIEIADYVDYRGKTPKKVDKGILLVTAKNIRFGYIDYDVSREYISSDDFEEVMRRGVAEIGDVLITTEAPLGNVASVDREDIALAQRVIKYRGKEGILNNSFLKQKFLSEDFQALIASKATGGTVQGIKGSTLHSLEISIPKDVEEQTKIANFLLSIDQKIEVVVQQIEQAKQWKKGLLQQMFV